MRIIGGEFKGRSIQVAKNLPARPTTDFAREALFNVLNNGYHFEGRSVLDLFAGTGLIGLEFLSRGASSLVSVDFHQNCIKHLRQLSRSFESDWTVLRKNVFSFVPNCKVGFDFIFADPPYDNPKLKDIPTLILKNETILNKNGLLILEHSKRDIFSEHINFVETRKYGNVNFSFFRK